LQPMSKRPPKSSADDPKTPTPQTPGGFRRSAAEAAVWRAPSGSISDWAAEIAEEAEKPTPPSKSKIKDPAKLAELAPGAPGSSKRTARTSSKERERAGGDGSVAANVEEGRKAKLSPKGAKATYPGQASSRKASLKRVGPRAQKRRNQPNPRAEQVWARRTRRASGLPGVSILSPGMDMSLEEAEELEAKLKQHKKDNKKKSAADGRYGELGGKQGATATVEALSALIESGNPLHKNGELWVPHRPDRPEKSEGGVPIKLASEYEPKGDQPTAIAELVEGITSASRPRCCSASPARARPTPWRRSSSAPSARR
jgi:excinuclease ABC subunit B